MKKPQKPASKPIKKSDSDDLTRLNKYIANSGICSRREADELIKEGLVKVNDKEVVEMGFKVKPGDVVSCRGKVIKPEKFLYVLLNKPKDFISTTRDTHGRKTVMDLVAKAGKERIYPVGRLDRDTTGLLLFTNDGDMAKRLTHPSHEIRKLYHVTLNKEVLREDLERLKEGVELEDGYVHVDDVQYVEGVANNKEVGLEIHSGKKRVVRRLFIHLGYEVIKLDRVVFAQLNKKDLPRGKWRYLSISEVGLLKRITGKTEK